MRFFGFFLNKLSKSLFLNVKQSADILRALTGSPTTSLTTFLPLILMMSSFLFSCHEKATKVLYVGQIKTRVGVVFVSEFSDEFCSDFFTLLLVRPHQAEIITAKHFI